MLQLGFLLPEEWLVLSVAALGIFSFLMMCCFWHFLPYPQVIWHRSSSETAAQPLCTLQRLVVKAIHVESGKLHFGAFLKGAEIF